MRPSSILVASILWVFSSVAFAQTPQPYVVLTWLEANKTTDHSSKDWNNSFHPIEYNLFGDVFGRTPEEALKKYREIMASQDSNAKVKVANALKEVRDRIQSEIEAEKNHIEHNEVQNLVQPRQDDKLIFAAIQQYATPSKEILAVQKAVKQLAPNNSLPKNTVGIGIGYHPKDVLRQELAAQVQPVPKNSQH